MHATAQRDEQVSLLPLDLNPPVRAESIDLRALISHRSATQASASVESVADTFKTGSANFVAVRWLTRARRSIDSARTGGLRSIGADETCSSRCAVAYIDISLSDFENHGVLQIYDI